MAQAHIFKYKDTTDGKYAFIIHTKEEDARKILEEETVLDFMLVGSKKLEDVPAAHEFWFNSYNNVYINEIMPF